MSKKNKGWDYLNSDDVNSISDGSKGDWGYTKADGSGSFHGGDGSWNYKNADGSGSYHGSDGSWGYKNTYGSGSFYGSSGSSDFEYDNDADKCSNGSSLGEMLGTIIGIGLVGVMAAGTKAVTDEREREVRQAAERREQVHLNRNKRHAWRKKHRRGIAITILILTIAVFFAIEYYEVQKLIPIGCSSENLEGLKYTEVVQKLKEAGFSNVQTKEISDLTISRDAEEKLVTDIKLIFGDSFDENTKYPSNLGITVVYHTVELYNPPLTSKKAKGMNYIDVIREFENVGFTNVTTNVEYDIVTGWLTDDGEVKSVTINGKKEFDSDDKYRLDAEVVVTYHTLKKNKPK